MHVDQAVHAGPSISPCRHINQSMQTQIAAHAGTSSSSCRHMKTHQAAHAGTSSSPCIEALKQFLYHPTLMFGVQFCDFAALLLLYCNIWKTKILLANTVHNKTGVLCYAVTPVLTFAFLFTANKELAVIIILTRLVMGTIRVFPHFNHQNTIIVCITYR